MRALLLLIPAGLGAFLACSSEKVTYIDEPIDDAGIADVVPSDSSLVQLSFRPARAYSGFDGTHAFEVPVAVYNAGEDVTVTADDPATADVKPATLANPAGDTGAYFLVTAKKAGTIALTARSEGRTATSTITVTEYPADRWATGDTRYRNGAGGDPPCTDCHAGASGVDHSPAALATVTDDKVKVTITTGVSPFGSPILVNGQPGHKWTATEAELDGLVTYLRALAPKGFQ